MVFFQVRKFSYSFGISLHPMKSTPEAQYSLGLGIMSGTSCDGLDLACCHFQNGGATVRFFKTATYPDELRQRLLRVMHMGAAELVLFENEFTAFSAKAVVEALNEWGLKPGFIGAHGHTVFHRPDAGLTFQMLNGGMLAGLTSLPVVCDFRRQDVAGGGQGAPLVPLGDRLLFSEYDACLNLGGVANISFMSKAQPTAFDICPANLILNELSQGLGMPYDKGGAVAASGAVIPELLESLSKLGFYALPPPKSLGREWFETVFMSYFREGRGPTRDLLATAVEHVADTVAASLNTLAPGSKVLVTGGGALNPYLMQLLRQKSHCEIPQADRLLIDAKEALIFALLARLRLLHETNVLSEITGARRSVSAGAVYLP